MTDAKGYQNKPDESRGESQSDASAREWAQTSVPCIVEQKRTEGQSAHHGDLEGPSAADAGKVQAPQKGDPHSDARQS